MRPALSVVFILVVVITYVITALLVSERLPTMPSIAQALYWCAAGLLWVLPVRWLMLWGAGKR